MSTSVYASRDLYEVVTQAAGKSQYGTGEGIGLNVGSAFEIKCMGARRHGWTWRCKETCRDTV